uniref:Uncharacterized protein n=1 Tax=Triticum urartu TaxID=4572 RepID=A0A8R7P4J0_TRIUA
MWEVKYKQAKYLWESYTSGRKQVYFIILHQYPVRLTCWIGPSHKLQQLSSHNIFIYIFSGGRLEVLELLEVLPGLLPHLGLVELLGAALLDLDGEVVHAPGHHLLPHLHQPLELQQRVGLGVVLGDGERGVYDGWPLLRV